MRGSYAIVMLEQHVREPTRLDNLLDLIVTDQPLAVNDVRVDDAGLVSDHRLVTASVAVRSGLREPVEITSRQIRGIDTVKFESDRVALSVSTSRSRDGLETYPGSRLVSSRKFLATSRSRLGLEAQGLVSVSWVDVSVSVSKIKVSRLSTMGLKRGLTIT